MFASPARCCLAGCRAHVMPGRKSHLVQAVTGYGRRGKHDKGSCCKDIAQTEGKRVEPWPKSDPPPPAWRCECPTEPQPPNYDPYRIKVPDVVVPPLPPSNAKPMIDCAKTKGPCSLKPVLPAPPCPPPPPKPFPWIYVWAVASFFGLMGLIYRIYLWREEMDRISENVPIWRPRRKVKRPYHDKDLPACVQYLIVGAGAAGWAAYRAIMEHDKTAKVFFISKEDCLPYQRPPLSKYMWWNPEPPDLKTLNYIKDGRRKTMYVSECSKFMDPVKFYRKKVGPAVSIATGWCVLRVDAENHIAYIKTMCGEQPMYYERCLLAPGSKPKQLSIFKNAPKAVRDRVTTLRTIRDLEIAYRKVKDSKHVVIIGGGTIGCELAWHFGKMNQVVQRKEDQPPLQVVHMFKDKGILSSVLPEYLGEWAAEKIRCEGVTLVPKTQVYDAFESPDGRLELTLSNGSSMVTDYVFVAVGADPRVEMAQPSFLETDDINNGFLVNTELEARTHLYVAGDAASFYSQWKDSRLRFEHYDNAEEQGYIAGANMTGYWIPANMEPHYWLVLGDALEMQVSPRLQAATHSLRGAGLHRGNMTGYWVPANMEPHYWLVLGDALEMQVSPRLQAATHSLRGAGLHRGGNMTGYWIPANMEPHYWLVLGDALQMQVSPRLQAATHSLRGAGLHRGNMTGYWVPANMEPHYWLVLGDALEMQVSPRLQAATHSLRGAGLHRGGNMTGYWIPANMEPHYWLVLGDALQMQVSPRLQAATHSLRGAGLHRGNMTGYWVPANMEPHYWLVLGDALEMQVSPRLQAATHSLRGAGLHRGNMTGYWIPANMEPHYWLVLGDALEMQVVGECGACMPTVGLFKQCTPEEAAKKPPSGDGDRPCYKKSEEYKNRYKRGLVFYLRDEIVVGMVFWNMPPIDDRKEVATELLRARPSYKDINLLAELVGFPDTQCVYASEEELKEPGPCIKK
ncbi:uncharacterized protein LOC135081364 [Ostrinia nubilalis]|uniref:uncharacterized protein LOC135081364 n=1 Tax=Ostrinia nubilalis TaxID=29057 RepID=UPI003082375A